MSFFKRLFSSDHRAALTAEAAGDFELAAERYALAGQYEAAVRMHLARADRAKSRADEIEALRDALHWAKDDELSLGKARKALGKALLSQSQAEGIHTERDRERVREAADLLMLAGLYEHAGDAFLSIGDAKAAASAFRAGGLVARLEYTLSREQEQHERQREESNAFADYELNMRGGARDAALEHLRHCVHAASERGHYRQLLDELESKLITGGRVVLRGRRGRSLALCSAREVYLGRDSLCDLVLRTGGVSRRHALIAIDASDEGTRFSVADAGSRNGTRVGGMPIQDALALHDRGSVFLGEDLELHYLLDDAAQVLRLSVERGVDAGAVLLLCREGQPMPLVELDVGAHLRFASGRPILSLPAGTSVRLLLNGEAIAHGEIQLIHGDVVAVDGVELEVE